MWHRGIIPAENNILALGFLPENELMIKANISISKVSGYPFTDENLQTNINGIFACGSAIHKYDYVESINDEAYRAGKSAANFILKSI